MATHARAHAVMAHELLNGIKAWQERLDAMSVEERMHHIASGAVQRSNKDIEWTAQLSIAHSLAAIAWALSAPIGAQEATRRVG